MFIYCGEYNPGIVSITLIDVETAGSLLGGDVVCLRLRVNSESSFLGKELKVATF